ncbi:MAG: phosphoenolpyruvate--protein phosphotransferase [Verrucomicrobia bacterium]|nr:phosphoenolpyruvate--protein phosphotransferase [Verrucomicrobiota bacterium]
MGIRSSKQNPLQEGIHPSGEERVFQGTAVAPGIAEGKVLIHFQEEESIPFRDLKDHELDAEVARFEGALLATRKEILELQERLSQSAGASDAGIFDAHLMVLEDPTLIDEVIKGVWKEKHNAEFVFQGVIHKFIKTLSAIDDPYLRERAIDLEDVARRVIRHLLGKSGQRLAGHDRNHIIVADELTPSDTATLNRDNVAGFITEKGSKTSHVAIMARSLGIPAIVGLEGICTELENGSLILIDGYSGKIFLNPSHSTHLTYQAIAEEKELVEEGLEVLRESDSTTLDGHHIVLAANIELPEELDEVAACGADGIGLYRTEFLYFNRVTPPDEEEQYAVYRSVAEKINPQPVIIRTLDIGGDKPTDCLDLALEQNPFLGCRAIRFCLNNPEIFKTQLRAILRAGIHGNLKMMFPMISGIEELFHAKALLAEAAQELSEQGVPHKKDIELGIMIEVPSAALMADVLAREVKFFSIGTNDLLQYLMAVDRGNERIAHLHDPSNPAVVRILKTIVDGAHAAGIWVGVCGELAGDIEFTPLLIGLGIDELSASAVLVPRVKKAIRSLDVTACREIVERALSGERAAEIYARTTGLARMRYPDLF